MKITVIKKATVNAKPSGCCPSSSTTSRRPRSRCLPGRTVMQRVCRNPRR